LKRYRTWVTHFTAIEQSYTGVVASFVLGQEGADFLRIDVSMRTNPAATDYWDGNWVVAEVSVSSGPWSGSYRANLRAEDFLAFRDHLLAIYEDVDVQLAKFSSMEPWLEVVVERSDRLGHLTLKGTAHSEPFFEGHDVLQFVFEIDQSYLPEGDKRARCHRRTVPGRRLAA
jgi:hypothetical protein